MLLFLLLLVACASGQDYVRQKRKIDGAKTLIDLNVLSISGDVPDLSDPRRHQTEIIHVIIGEAQAQANSCLILDYNEVLERESAVAVSKPQQAADEIQAALDDFNEQTKQLQGLIKNCKANGGSDKHCNNLVDKAVKNAPPGSTLVIQAEQLEAAAAAAQSLLNKASEFEKVSNDLRAHQYVIQGEQALKKVIQNLTKLFASLKKPLHPC